MTRIEEPSIRWDDKGNPSSLRFDDVYYNRKSGLDETRLVYLEGNNLPSAWQQKDNFVIAETGFGTGLNFLATWQMFEETALHGERLDFISVEKYPLRKDDLTRALQPWRVLLGDARIDRFLAVYPPRFPGFHRRWVTDRVTLTVIFDDVSRAFAQVQGVVDAWFLDGFTPKKNAEMWQPGLFADIARLSHSETTLASFTAVGHIRRTLAEIGFSVQRKKGYAYKFHRTVAKFTGGPPRPVVQKPDQVTIIGAGLAGSAAAYALQRRRIACTILEREKDFGFGASGNKLGLINPRIEAQDNPRNDAGLSAFSFANHVLADLPDVDYVQSGALHLGGNEIKTEKLQKILRSGDWLSPHITSFPAIPDGVFYADSGHVNTAKLVKALVKNIPVKFNQIVETIPNGPTILATGWGLQKFLPDLPLQPVRGQVTYATLDGLRLDHQVMFGHYIAPMDGKNFALGASFEQNNSSVEIKDSDDQKNITAAQNIFPQIKNVTVTAHWAGVRTASRDRFPVTGKVPGHDNLYVSGALGSHGIQFSLLHGEILACLLTGDPLPIGHDALQSLSVERFNKVKS